MIAAMDNAGRVAAGDAATLPPAGAGTGSTDAAIAE
jgi:hypothetical protein